MQTKLRSISLAIGILALSTATTSQAQSLRESAQKALSSNPEVLAKWHTFQAASSSKDAAFGAYLPNVNLNANTGRDYRETRLGKNELSRNSASLSLNQMIYDGFFTYNQVKQFDQVKQVRFYEALDTTDAITLEVARAYADVTRYRKMVALAEDNYVRHRAVFEQIQSKAKAGVGRRVDLEQISGRLALAEANLITESANLHDVSARFQRLVGTAPNNLENLSLLSKDIPNNLTSALRIAFENHPALLASIQNVAAVDSSVSSRKANYQPRLDFRARTEHGSNLDYISGRNNNHHAELVLSWNLFNGLSDKARVQEAANSLNAARDLREKACRDIRQNLSIAYNDIRKLTEQLSHLDQHQLAIEKARDAYRQQFDIGQRSLLDLLDTENELYQAKRAFANAEIDLFTAYARTHNGMGKLHTTLGLTRFDTKDTPKNNAATSENCSLEAPDVYVSNKNELNQRALEGLGLVTGKETSKPAANVAPTANAGDAKNYIFNALNNWRDAWISRNTDAYFGFYAPKFTSREPWKAQRRSRLNSAQNISLELSDIKFEMKNATHASTTFKQDYRSATYQDSLRKTLEWQLINGKWLIVNETVTGSGAKQW